MEHSPPPHGPALAVAGLAALAVQPFLTEIYQALASLALVSGVAATWLQIYWKGLDRIRESQHSRRNLPRIYQPESPTEAD